MRTPSFSEFYIELKILLEKLSFSDQCQQHFKLCDGFDSMWNAARHDIVNIG